MKEPLKGLIPLLGDRNRAVRRDAAWTLYFILMETSKPVAPPVMEAMGKSLSDRDPHVSHAIASALGAYVSCLKTHYVAPSVISEIIGPARENIKKYGHNRNADELLSGLLTVSGM